MSSTKEVCDLDTLEFEGSTVLCRVCGDKASGFHYGVHACEGCKGFFRRSIQQKLQYRPCLKNQQCNILRVNRNRCQYCRLKKCISVGMSRDAVRFGRVPKREKAKIMEQMHKVNAQSQISSLNQTLENHAQVAQRVIESHLDLCQFTSLKFRCFQERAWMRAEFVDCPPHKACPLNPASGQSSQWDLSDLFTPAIRNVVNFAKSIPGFQVFSQEDQVTLLKAGTFEVLLVHLAPLFDSRSNTMLFANGQLYKKESSAAAGSSAGYLLHSMFDFSEQLSELNLTDAEVALFSALVLMADDRPGLRHPEQVARVKSTLAQALEELTRANHPMQATQTPQASTFTRLLGNIPHLRTLNMLHSEKLLGLSGSMSPTSPQCHRAAHCSSLLLPTDRVKDESLTSSDANQPIIGHPVAMDTPHPKVVLNTPMGVFHRSHMTQATPPAPECSAEGKAKGHPSRKRSGEFGDGDKNPKRPWDYDMRTSRSDSLSSAGSVASGDSYSSPLPHSPHTYPPRDDTPVLKEALTAPPLTSLLYPRPPFLPPAHLTRPPNELSAKLTLKDKILKRIDGSDEVLPPGYLALHYQAMLHPALVYRHYAALHHQLLHPTPTYTATDSNSVAMDMTPPCPVSPSSRLPIKIEPV